MRKYFFNTAFTILITVVFTMPVFSQGKTSVKVTVDRALILIGEHIKLSLEAAVPEHEPIRFFQIDSIPHFEVLNKGKIDTANTSDGTILSQVIHITSFDSGHWVIPSFSLEENIFSDSIQVDVGFAAFNSDQPYHDIKDIIEVTPEGKKEEKIKWWYIVAGVALLLFVLVLVFRKKKKPVVQTTALPPDPFLVAIGKLEKLQKEKVEAKQYYSELVDIFREYIFAKKRIHSMQDTTDNLVKQLRSLNIPNDQLEHLTQTLQLSDFVKFAKYVPKADDDKNAFDTISRSIQQIEQIQ